MSLLFTAAATGLLGSLHCAAMCGPLAIAGASRGGGVDARQAAAYLGGRFTGYAATGVVMGALGQHALCNLPVATVQTAAVVLVAGLMALRGLAALLPRRAPEPVRVGRRVVGLGTRWTRLLARLPRRGVWLGLATALLPCGMLVPAWLLAASSGSPAGGAAVMVVFAAASSPGLLLPMAGRRLWAAAATKLPRQVHGLAWCALAAWVALRPLLGAAHHH
jgi:sulfite exporter TauE/SafE